MKAIIDRFEESKAVLELENGELQCVDRQLVKDAKEGDAIIMNGDAFFVTEKTDTHSIFEKLRNKSKNEG